MNQKTKDLIMSVQAKNRFTQHNYYELETLEQDHVVYKLDIREESRNLRGMVHGGMLMAMADDAAGCAAHTDGRNYVTQNATLHFLKNQHSGVIRADGRVRRRGRMTCLSQVDIINEKGDLLATGEYCYFCIDNK